LIDSKTEWEAAESTVDDRNFILIFFAGIHRVIESCQARRLDLYRVFKPSAKEKRMKKSLVTALIAAPLLAFSSMASAVEASPQEPMLLSAAQMDGVTAGTASRNFGLWGALPFFSNNAVVNQINISPVIIVQIGNNNYASVISGNFSTIFQ
jgi:hypothetical protein